MNEKPQAAAVAAELYFLPVATRTPLRFGLETTTSVTCARARLVLEGARADAVGWGETPLNAAWLWPSALAHAERDGAMRRFCAVVRGDFPRFSQRETTPGHPMEIGHAFIRDRLPLLLKDFNRERAGREPMPWLAALACFSPFDLACHDAFGNLLGLPTYKTYDGRFMARDLSHYYGPEYAGVFAGKYPADFLVRTPAQTLGAWHLVGGLDAVDESDPVDDAPNDGLPKTLVEWIRRDGLTLLKIKLRGGDFAWDCRRLSRVGDVGRRHGVHWLCADFNCGVDDPEYVRAFLARLKTDRPELWSMLLYVEQPFPYDLDKHRLDVHSLSERKPLFMDESAHGWEQVALGRSLGWDGVALKTCKTQTGALLALCWAKAHGMRIMVQDLTNPMLAQIPHLLLAAHAGTMMGVESNGMQYYPAASEPEAAVHPGLYRRRNGRLDLRTLGGTGFGYRIGEIERRLPEQFTIHNS